MSSKCKYSKISLITVTDKKIPYKPYGIRVCIYIYIYKSMRFSAGNLESLLKIWYNSVLIKFVSFFLGSSFSG